MFERLHFLLVYVGSAAMVAFLAACLSSPRIATFTCDASGANAAEHCEIADTLAAVASTAGDVNPADVGPDAPVSLSATQATAR